MTATANFRGVSWGAASGTSLQGHITTTYARLVQVFGEPNEASDKTTAEWILEFSDGTIATIYDWKEYATPQGEYRWHIGGFSMEAVMAVGAAVFGTR